MVVLSEIEPHCVADNLVTLRQKAAKKGGKKKKKTPYSDGLIFQFFPKFIDI